MAPLRNRRVAVPKHNVSGDLRNHVFTRLPPFTAHTGQQGQQTCLILGKSLPSQHLALAVLHNHSGRAASGLDEASQVPASLYASRLPRGRLQDYGTGRIDVGLASVAPYLVLPNSTVGQRPLSRSQLVVIQYQGHVHLAAHWTRSRSVARSASRRTSTRRLHAHCGTGKSSQLAVHQSHGKNLDVSGYHGTLSMRKDDGDFFVRVQSFDFAGANHQPAHFTRGFRCQGYGTLIGVHLLIGWQLQSFHPVGGFSGRSTLGRRLDRRGQQDGAKEGEHVNASAFVFASRSAWCHTP